MIHLSLTEINQPQEVDVVFEGRRRFVVAIGNSQTRTLDSANEEVCYWRMVGGQNENLLTVDLLRKSGRLFGIEVGVYVGDIARIDKPFSLPGGATCGTPVFDLSSWRDILRGPNVVDVREPFKLVLWHDALEIVTKPKISEGTAVELSERLVCLFDAAKDLSSIVIRGMHSAELNGFA